MEMKDWLARAIKPGETRAAFYLLWTYNGGRETNTLLAKMNGGDIG
jgi:hypothetical protein